MIFEVNLGVRILTQIQKSKNLSTPYKSNILHIGRPDYKQMFSDIAFNHQNPRKDMVLSFVETLDYQISFKKLLLSVLIPRNVFLIGFLKVMINIEGKKFVETL